MADIQTYIEQIESAIYGKDVRQAIVDALNQCYADASEGITPEITTSEITGGTRITITVGSVSKYVDVMNGADGEDGTATDAQVETYVSSWLDDHPEATTTVEDGAISKAKLTSELQTDIETAKAVPSAIGLETTYTGVESDSIDINLNNRKAEFGITYTGNKCYSKTNGELINAVNGGYWSTFRYKPNTRYQIDDSIHVVFFNNNMEFVSCVDAVTEGTQTITAPSTEGFVGFSSTNSKGLAYTNTYAKWVYTDYFVTGTDHKISAQVDWNNVYNRDYIDESLDDVDLLSTAFHVYPINVADGKVHQIEYGKTYASNPYVNYDANQSVGVVTFYNANMEKIANPAGIGTTGSGTYGWSNRSGVLTIIQGTMFSITGNVISSYAVYGGGSGTITLADTPVYIKIESTTRWTVGVYTDEVPDGKVNCTYNDEDSEGFIEDISDSLATNIATGNGNMSAIMQSSNIMTVNRMRHAWRIGSFNIYGANYAQRNWSALKSMLQNFGVDMIGFQEVNTPVSATNSEGKTFEQALTSWHLSEFAITETADSPTNCRPVATTGAFKVIGQTEVKYTQQSNYGHRHYTRTEIQLPKWKDKKWSEYLKLSFYNTQLEVGTSSANIATRLSQVNELITAMQADPNPFIVLTGDFNEMSPNFATREALKNAGFTPVLADESTCTVPSSSRGYYDNIFVNNRISIIDNDVVPSDNYTFENGMYIISDHDLVLADVLPDYTNIITVKKNDTQNHCTISGVENWLDRRQTEPVTVTITADSGYTFKSVTMYQGDGDINYGTNPFVINGNTVTIYPDRVVGDIIINPTCEANS